MNLLALVILLYSSLLSICSGEENLFSIENFASNPSPTGPIAAAPSTIETQYLNGVIRTDPALSDTSFMTITRKEAQFLSCGAPSFGNIIPSDYNDFMLRLGSASAAFNKAHQSIDKSFGWSIPVEWASESKRVRWSEMAERLQLSLVALKPSADTYVSGDKRHLMPSIKINVKTDENSGSYDVFLFAPKDPPRPSGASIFRMGVPQSSFPVISAGPSSFPSPDNEALSQGYPDQSPVSVMGFTNDEPFIALGPSRVEETLKVQTKTLIKKQAQMLSETIKKKRENFTKQAELAMGAASGVANLMTGNNPATQLQRGITDLVRTVTGKEPTAAEQLSRTISNIRSGNVNIADIDSSLHAIADATGLPQIRRLEDAALSGTPSEMTSKPFVDAYLTVYDTAGNVLYGPTSMHCPFISIPMSKLKTSDTVMMFEITLKTRDGTIIADDLRRPLKVKKFVLTEKINDKVDDPSKCPQLILGARLLDVDFDEFTHNTATRLVVRHLLAESLGVSRSQITFCKAKNGSTIIGFDAGTDRTLQWREIVTDPSAPIHRVLQLDSEFESLVDKDYLYSRNPMIDNYNAGASVIPNIEHRDIEQRDTGNDNIINLPIFETESLHGIAIPIKDERAALREIRSKKSAPIPDDQALPAWAWALIGIGLFVVVGLLISLIVLCVLSRRKLKNDDDIVRQPLESSDGEDTFCGGDHLLPGEAGRVGVSVEIRSPAAHREGRRHYDN